MGSIHVGTSNISRGIQNEKVFFSLYKMIG